MVRKLRLRSGEEAPVERITKQKTKHKMIKVKIKMRRNFKSKKGKNQGVKDQKLCE